MLCQSPSDRSRLLSAQIGRDVFLALVVQAQVMALRGVDHCQNARDGFAEVVAGRNGRNKCFAFLEKKEREREGKKGVGKDVLLTCGLALTRHHQRSSVFVIGPVRV